MSSLSDHFALNTTLRNFCFLAHTHYFTEKHSRKHFMATYVARISTLRFAHCTNSHNCTHWLFKTLFWYFSALLSHYFSPTIMFHRASPYIFALYNTLRLLGLGLLRKRYRTLRLYRCHALRPTSLEITTPCLTQKEKTTTVRLLGFVQFRVELYVFPLYFLLV